MNQLWNDMNNWTGSFLLYFQLLQKGIMTRCVVEKAKVQRQQALPLQNCLQNLSLSP